jgi:hypothetical protein
VAERQVKAELGYSYNDYLDKYNASAATNAGTSLIAGTIDSSGVSTAYDQTQWGDAIENRQAALYNDAYATAYSSANQSSSTSGSQSGNSGIVTANFKTINQGEASTQDNISTFTDTALAAARGQHGESWTANPDGSTKTVNGVSYAVNTSEWNESFNNTLSDTLANSIQAAQSTSTSESTVDESGI